MTLQKHFNGRLKGRDFIGECWIVETDQGQDLQVSEYDLQDMSDEDCMALHFAKKVTGTYEDTCGKSFIAENSGYREIKVTSLKTL